MKYFLSKIATTPVNSDCFKTSTFFFLTLVLHLIAFSSIAHAQGLSDLVSSIAHRSSHGLHLEGRRQNQDRTEMGSVSGHTTLLKTDKHNIGLQAQYEHSNYISNNASLTDLYEAKVGATYNYQLTENKSYSLALSYGSKSDQLFKNSSVNTLSLNAAYSFKSSERGHWLLLLNYSNNRPFLNNIPLPFFAYSYTYSKDFRGTFGAPFASIFWRFKPKWSLTLFTIAPWILKAQVGYSIAGPIQAYLGVDISQQSFFEYGRSNLDERIFYEEKTLFIGFRSPITKNLFASLEFGNSFDRTFFFAEDYSTSPDDPVSLDSSLYSYLSLRAMF